MSPQDKAAEALRLAHLLNGRYALSHEYYVASAALLREYAALLQARPAEAGRVPLTDEQLLAIAREEAHGDTIKLAREVGPYAVTEVTHVYRSIARAIERHHGILPKEQKT